MLSARTLLDAWERGGGRPPLQQALFLLGAAHPESPPEALAQMPVGRRDGLLLDLREQTFGPNFESVAACPRCGAWLELAFTAADVRQPPPETDGPLTVRHGGYAVTVRLPTSEDLVALAADPGPAPEHRLLARCVESATADGEAVAAADLPAPVVAAVSEQMGAADPQANVTTALTCPDCEHAWEQLFDVGMFLWAEVEAWARRTLAEVHALAVAYGWTEREVLSLSAQRRRLYLERVAA